MYPPIWGTYYWKVIHLSCLSYPMKPNKIEKANMNRFIISICYLLPCPQCRHHALKYINKIKPNLANRISILYWSFDFHNEVNKRTGKKQLSYETCLKTLTNINVNEVVTTELKRVEDHQKINEIQLKIKEKENIIYVLCAILLIAIVIILYVLIKRKKRVNIIT